MSDRSTTTSSGIGLGGAIFIVFLVLKLTDNIDWSWVWVTSPLWIPFGIAAAVMLIALMFAGLSVAWAGAKPKRKKK